MVSCVSLSVLATGARFMTILQNILSACFFFFEEGCKKNILLERARFDTSTSLSWRNAIEITWKSIGAVVGFVFPVPAHGIWRSVEVGRVYGI